MGYRLPPAPKTGGLVSVGLPRSHGSAALRHGLQAVARPENGRAENVKNFNGRF